MMFATLQKPITLLIAEDHELARTGLSITLDEKEAFDVVGEVVNGQDVLNFVAKQPVDVILMDIGMPELNGISATERIKQLYPQIKVIMLTSHTQEDEVFASLAAGADAYCLKNIAIDRLQQVIEMVMDGAIWLDPEIARMVMKALPNPAQPACAPQSFEASCEPEKFRQQYNTDLTPREREVLELLVGGKTNKEIAADMDITAHTAKAHVSNIIQKLAVDDRTQAAVKALKEGLVH